MGGVVSGIGSALGIGSPKQPKAPDYSSLQTQQAGLDKATAGELTAANRPNQNTYGGSINWSQDPSGNWTQNLNYSPNVAAAHDSAMALQAKTQQGLMNQGAFQGPASVGAFDPHTGDTVANAYYKSVMDRAAPLQATQRDQLTTQLRQGGLTPGTQAYDSAMKTMLDSQGDVNTTAAQNAVNAGYSQATSMYDEALKGQGQQYSQAASDYARPWDTASAATTMNNQQYTPQFAGFGTATGYAPADMAGAAQAQYQSKLGAAGSSSGKLGGLLNTGLKGVAGYAGGGGIGGAIQGMAG